MAAWYRMVWRLLPVPLNQTKGLLSNTNAPTSMSFKQNVKCGLKHNFDLIDDIFTVMCSLPNRCCQPTWWEWWGNGWHQYYGNICLTEYPVKRTSLWSMLHISVIPLLCSIVASLKTQHTKHCLYPVVYTVEGNRDAVTQLSLEAESRRGCT